MTKTSVTKLVLDLYKIDAVKFGNFKLKSGINSPIYLDLRACISYPEILQAIANLVWDIIKDLSFDVICAVPYTAIPIATAISLQHKIPMLLRRKEVKQHGTSKIIEGVFYPEQTCLVVEDLITSGASILETITPLEEVGLKVVDAVVLLDRMQNGKAKLAAKGYQLHSVLTLPEMLDILLEHKQITAELHQQIKEFLQRTQF